MEMLDAFKDAKRRNKWFRRLQRGISGSNSCVSAASVTTKGYKYRPLGLDKKQIRVLRFERGRKSSFRRIRFKVEELSLQDDTHEPSYAISYAISYAWGGNPGLASIILDGQEAMVPDSADEALRGILRVIAKDDHLGTTLIWIDAICINQNDLEEKPYQVADMASVFERSCRVFSWLGSDDGTTQAGLRSLEALQKQFCDLTDDEHDLDYLRELDDKERNDLPCMLAPPPAHLDFEAVFSLLGCR